MFDWVLNVPLKRALFYSELEYKVAPNKTE